MPEARHFVALNEVNTLRIAPAGAGAVELLLVDDVFAPGHESLTIAYAVHTAVARARLEVRCPLHGAEPLFVAPLQPDDLHPGSRYTFAWDGITTCSAGELAGNYVNPLYAPYDVVIVYDDGTAEAETPARSFVVRYHSLKIDIGPWTADHQPPAAAQRDKWLRYHLNKAGYWAGPVEEDLDDGLSKAIKRYKRHHPREVRGHASEYDNEVSEQLEADLVAGRFAREVFMPETGNAFADSAAESRLMVEAIFAELGELSSGRKLRDGVLNRPTLPIAIKILLRSKSGEGVDSPLAVGHVRVDLRVEDVAEDLTRQVSIEDGNPSLARRYIEKVHAEFDTSLRRNCPVSNGGISQEDGSWRTAVVSGAAFPPFFVQVDTSNNSVYCHAAPVDVTPPPAAGRAVFLFRPSIIAGDGYRLRASLNFADRANGSSLAALNGRIAAKTGVLRIWRGLAVASRVIWTSRPNARWDLSFSRDQFAPAYLHIGGSPRTIPIADVLDDEAYREALSKRTVPNPEDFRFTTGGIYGGPLTQTEDAGEDYVGRLAKEMETFYYDRYVDNRVARPWSELGFPIRRSAQVECGYGVHVVEHSIHPHVTVFDRIAGKEVVRYPDFVVVQNSFAGESGVIFINQDGRSEDVPEEQMFAHLVTHEMAHTLLLEHHRDPKSPLADEAHDDADGACEMRPHVQNARAFCGKCVLSLRGWWLDGLPAGSA